VKNENVSTSQGSLTGAFIVVGLLLLIGIMVFSHNASRAPQKEEISPAQAPSAQTDRPATSSERPSYPEAPSSPLSGEPTKPLPKLLDLGTTQCIPCRMMIPVIEELRTECAGRLIVEFIDLTKDRSAGIRYGVRAIPLQIFLDPSGKELFRHEGYWSKEDILRKWEELGYDLR